jgi:hypothetical protein
LQTIDYALDALAACKSNNNKNNKSISNSNSSNDLCRKLDLFYRCFCNEAPARFLSWATRDVAKAGISLLIFQKKKLETCKYIDLLRLQSINQEGCTLPRVDCLHTGR